jgi:hypothetical protein
MALKRYTATIDMYIFAENDTEAKKKANRVADRLRMEQDNQAKLLTLYETPFASVESREIPLKR